MGQNANWSEVLKSDLDKLARITASHPGRGTTIQLKEGERRNVTILFLDIQGFTAMSEKLDPEDVQLIIDNCFKILTNEIERYHGFIDKYEGDRMMALFGSRQASEQDCENALRAALGMRERFQDINRILAERNIKIGVRVGVNTGLVVTGRIGKGRDQDFTVMGDAVNLASRLETNAPPGEILISEETRRVVKDMFLYEALGKIEVKGKTEPVEVYCVKGLNAERKERWERSPFTQRSGYVGREKEDRQLVEAVRQLCSGEKLKRAFLVSGSPGVGKSRLVHEFCRSIRNAYGNPPIILKGMAVSDHASPLGLFSELFRPMVIDVSLSARLFDSSKLEETERLKEALGHITGTSTESDRLSALDPSALRLELQVGIRVAMERLAKIAVDDRRLPLIVRLEDLQWADTISLEMIKFLAANFAPAAPVLILATARPEFIMDDELQKALELEEIALPPLSENACAAILDNVIEGAVFSMKERDYLIQRSGGNPFFMEELIQSLVDGGTLRRDEAGKWKLGHAIDEGMLPDSVHRILLGRIDNLDPPRKEMLTAASVVGETIPLNVMFEVGDALGVERTEILNRLNSLCDQGFLYPKNAEGPLGKEMAFRHALTRDVVYSTLLNHNKKILHEVVGSGLESLYGEEASDHATLLFHHFSNTGQSERAVDYGLAAVDQVVRQYSTKDGFLLINAVKTIVAENPALRQARSARMKLAEAEIRLLDFLGDRQQQVKAIEAFEMLGQGEGLPEFSARSALFRAIYASETGEFRKTKEIGQGGLAHLGSDDRDPKLRMELLRAVGIACYNMGQYSEAQSFYREGLAIAGKISERSAEGGFHNTMGLVHFHIGELPEAIECYTKGRDIMTSIGDRRGEANILGNRGLVYWTLGEYSQALDELGRSHEIFREIGFKKGQAVTLGNLGVIYQKLGQYDEAVKHFERALPLRREIHDRAGEGYDIVNVGVVCLQKGDLESALKQFESGQWLSRDVGSNYLLVECLNNLGVVYRKMGERGDAQLFQKAAEVLTEACAIAKEHNLLPGQIRSLSNLGKAYLKAGEKEKAFELSCKAMELVASHPSGVEGTEEEAQLNHYDVLQLLGRKSDARATLERLVKLIETRADKIRDPDHRRTFLEVVQLNRYALAEWKRVTGEAG